MNVAMHFSVWDMVFKGIQGMVPPKGGLRQLWQGDGTINSGNDAVQTLTVAPGMLYKSANVDLWRNVSGFLIESVSISYHVIQVV